MTRNTLLAIAAAVVVVAVSVAAGWETFRADRPRTEAQTSVRKPAVAGSFYPADKRVLEQTVADSLKSAAKETFRLPIRAILAPHAGYAYCGKVMAAAFKQVEGTSFQYDTVVMIGPSHGTRTRAAAASSASAWETPVGTVPVDVAKIKQLTEDHPGIKIDDAAHFMEHSLEVQIPYILAAARGKPFKIVPLLTNSADPVDRQTLARALAVLGSDPKTLIVVSSDLSHFPSGSIAEKVDKAMLDAVISLNVQSVADRDKALMNEGHRGLDCTMCGLESVLCLEQAASQIGITEARLVGYAHSGMISGDNGRVVGYGAVVFTGARQGVASKADGSTDLSLGIAAKREIMARVRSAVNAAVAGKKDSQQPSDNPELQVKAGCFVTLKNKDRLRGCIGCFQSDQPLWKTISEMAVSSSTQDHRFAANPIRPEEVSQLEIEVSVLSPLRKISRPLEEIKLGSDGIMIRQGSRSGTFLPQVATETGWSLEEFLGHCARDKAGIGWNGWDSPNTQVYGYTATIVSEKDLFSGEGR